MPVSSSVVCIPNSFCYSSTDGVCNSGDVKPLPGGRLHLASGEFISFNYDKNDWGDPIPCEVGQENICQLKCQQGSYLYLDSIYDGFYCKRSTSYCSYIDPNDSSCLACPSGKPYGFI